MDRREALPVGYSLVVDQDVGLGQKTDKAALDSKLPRRAPSVVSAHSAPAVEFRTSASKFLDLLDDAWERNGFCPHRANQGIVDIDVHNKWPISVHS